MTTSEENQSSISKFELESNNSTSTTDKTTQIVNNDNNNNNNNNNEDNNIDGTTTITNTFANDTVDNSLKEKVSEADKIKKPKLAAAGCLTCRQRHKRCTRVRPVCGTCQLSSYECFWREPGTRFADYNVFLVRSKNPQGRMLKPNASISNSNILSVMSIPIQKDTVIEQSSEINDNDDKHIDLLDNDHSLISLAQKAVSITNAYMNSPEMQNLLNNEKFHNFLNNEKKEKLMDDNDMKQNGRNELKNEDKDKEDITDDTLVTTEEVIAAAAEEVAAESERAKGKEEIKREADESNEGEEKEEEKEEEPEQEETCQGGEFKKDHDHDAEPDNDEENNLGNGSKSNKQMDDYNDDDANNQMDKGDDPEINNNTNNNNNNNNSGSSNNPNDYDDTNQLTKFKSLMDINDDNNEKTSLLPSPTKLDKNMNWYMKFLNSGRVSYIDEEFINSHKDDTSLVVMAQNKGNISPVKIMSNITEVKLSEKFAGTKKSYSFTNIQNLNNDSVENDVLLESDTDVPRSSPHRMDPPVQSVDIFHNHEKFSERRKNKKYVKKSLPLTKEAKARILRDALSTKIVDTEKKILKDGRRKRFYEEKHVDISQLPTSITQFLKQT